MTTDPATARRAQPYPHERRIQRYAYVALLAVGGIAVLQVLRGDGTILGIEVARGASFALLLLGLAVGLFGVQRRALPLTAVGAGLIVAGILPGGRLEMGALDYVIGLAFGVLLLVALELVHMMERYERAHKAVESEGVPEDHINRVTDEALKTLVGRALIAGLAAVLVVGAAYLLAALGPRAWREAIETTAPTGVAVVGLVALAAVSLTVLVRGARFRRAASQKPTQEGANDVAE